MSLKMLLVALFVAALESIIGTVILEEKVPKWREKEKIENNIPRKPVEFLLHPKMMEGNLYLYFETSLSDFSIYIYDVNGCIVHYNQSLDTDVVTIQGANAYPYSVEIISPVVSICGEIVLE